MNYPCGIIKDLLPLYIDDVCNNESRQAVESHLAECEDCKAEHEKMQKVSDLLGEVKFYYRSQNNRKRKSIGNRCNQRPPCVGILAH